MNGLRESDVVLPSLKMHVLSAGDPRAPLVVLLHGFPEFSESWREVLPLLADAGYHAVAPDLRGYGGTDKPKQGYDIDTLANDVSELIGALSPTGHARLVGHDWGGAIAYHLAAHSPSRVTKLAVVNCPHPSVFAKRLWRPRQLRRSWYMFFFQLPLLPERALQARGAALVPRAIASTMKDRSHFPEERAEKYARNFSQPGVAPAALAYYRQMIRGALRPSMARRIFKTYPKIEAPFRLVWGEEDVALGRELTVDLDEYFTHPPQVDYLDGVGHFSTIEAPERVARSLLAHFGPAESTKSRTSAASDSGAS